MDQLTIDHRVIHGIHMFCSEPHYSPEQKRIYGYKDSKRLGLALYPGFLPMAHHAVSDLNIVFDDALCWTDRAKERLEYIEEAENAVDKAELPDLPVDFVFEPYDHQREAIVKGFWQERVAIFHDCGLGKTKSMIDTFQLLKAVNPDFSALILCPSHLVRNWDREIEKHAPGTFRVRAMLNYSTNTPPHPDVRRDMYRGGRSTNPDPSWKFYDEFPNLYYEPLPEGLPGDIYEHERAYVDAIVNDDSRERTNARNRMRYRAKKHGFELPDASSWRMLDDPYDPAEDFDFLVMSYDTAVADEELIKEHFTYDAIAADESHYMRTYSSLRAKTACRLAKRAHRRYLMSGTPSLGNPMHLYKQLQFLSPALVNNWFRYTRRYLIKARYNQKMTVGYKNMHVLNRVVSDVAHRRKQEECLDLPEQRFITVPVDVGPATKRKYNDLVTNWNAIFEQGKRVVEVQQAADRINKLLQILSGFYIDSNKDLELCDGCPHLMDCTRRGIKPYTEDCKVEDEEPPKTILRLDENPRLDMASELVHDVMQEPDNKIIIWCMYTEELNMVEERLKAEDVGYVRVDGRTRNKVACEDKFREDSDCRVYLSHISISEGLTLNSANYVMYYGLTYDLKDYVQSLKRNHRIGQDRKVTVYRLVTPDSVHEFILKALDQKKDLAANMTDAVRCGTCEYQDTCLENDVMPFDEACIYSEKEQRVITKPKRL